MTFLVLHQAFHYNNIRGFGHGRATNVCGRHSIYTATTTVTNEWETIEFEFAERPDNTVPDGNVTSLILLFDIGNNTNDTYYFDNLYGPEFDNQCDDQAEESNIELADWDCHWNLSLCPLNPKDSTITLGMAKPIL